MVPWEIALLNARRMGKRGVNEWKPGAGTVGAHEMALVLA